MTVIGVVIGLVSVYALVVRARVNDPEPDGVNLAHTK